VPPSRRGEARPARLRKGVHGRSVGRSPSRRGAPMDTANPDGSQSANKQAGSRHYTALTCGLVIAAVLAPLFGTAFPRRSPVAFALTLILLVLLLVTVVKRAPSAALRRSRRAPRLRTGRRHRRRGRGLLPHGVPDG